MVTMTGIIVTLLIRTMAFLRMHFLSGTVRRKEFERPGSAMSLSVT